MMRSARTPSKGGIPPPLRFESIAESRALPSRRRKRHDASPPLNGFLLPAAFLVMFLSPIAAALVAYRRGHNPTPWFFLGFFIGPLAPVFAALLRVSEPPQRSLNEPGARIFLFAGVSLALTGIAYALVSVLRR
jgi:hypothetical protein